MTQEKSARDHDAVLARLADLHPKLIDLSLDRVRGLLADLENPHHYLPPVVHVAGTNGKGSLLAYLRAGLEAADYRVHVYTSPHLVKFNERIRLAGELIPDGDLTALLEDVERVNAGRPITYFEITTAAAFLAFANVEADVLLLETGLGGRLDATNVTPKPLLNAITPVHLDHQRFLGGTIAEIAGEKAGVMRRSVPCVVAEQDPEGLRIIEARASEKLTPLTRAGFDYHYRRDGDELVFVREDDPKAGRESRWPLPSLPGAHQLGNAAQALACFDAMAGFSIPRQARAQALGRAEWPARLQRLARGPLVDALPGGWELWLDGGHNPAAGAAIRDYAAENWGGEPLHVVCGLMNTKDPAGFLRAVTQHADSLACVDIPGEANTLRAEELAEAARGIGVYPTIPGGVAAALNNIVTGAAAPAPPARVLICGSLYLAGTVLLENG